MSIRIVANYTSFFLYTFDVRFISYRMYTICIILCITELVTFLKSILTQISHKSISDTLKYLLAKAFSEM